MQQLNKRFLVVGTVLGLTFLARTAIAQPRGEDSSGDGDAKACMSAADDSYASCSEGEPWYVRALCEAQQASDYAACAVDAVANKMY